MDLHSRRSRSVVPFRTATAGFLSSASESESQMDLSGFFALAAGGFLALGAPSPRRGFFTAAEQKEEPSERNHQRGTISFSSSWSALWWTHLSLPVMVSQTRSCWSRCRTSDRRRHRRRCRTLIRLQDKDGRALNLPAFLLRFLYRRAASRDSPLLLLLSEKADLDEKMLLVSFFFSTGTELQTEM